MLSNPADFLAADLAYRRDRARRELLGAALGRRLRRARATRSR